jgi:hypothetical protein
METVAMARTALARSAPSAAAFIKEASVVTP